MPCLLMLLGGGAALLGLALASAPQPYPPLSGGAFSGHAQPLSPDPLVRYVWSGDTDVSQLMVFNMTPVSAQLMGATLASSFVGWETLATPTPSVRVSGAGSLRIDFGVELPAWIELDSPDLGLSDLPLLQLGSSEYTLVDIIGTDVKQRVPIAYNGTYRLETNKELYEGVRFGFISVSAPPATPFTITGLRAVTQTKPVNYTGTYAADASSTRIWYTSAYTVRTNLERDYMGAILEDRGDRYSWAGDAHVSQAASLVAFANFWDVLQNINVTGKSQNGIASYSLYFADSVMDYYTFSHDDDMLEAYTPEVSRIISSAFETFNVSVKQTFFGCV